MKKHILIADDEADVVELLTRRCRALGLEVDSANNAMTALGKAEENAPDLVILDVDLPQGNGLSVCEMMANHEELSSIPVIILTASSNEKTVRRCHELCAYYVLKCPDIWKRIEPILCDLLGLAPAAGPESSPQVQQPEPQESRGSTELMDAVFAVLGVELGYTPLEDDSDNGQPRESQPWVLSIEDDDDFALGLELRLRELGVQVVRATAGTEGYRRAFLDAPCAIILDYELPQGNGDYVLRRLKETPATSKIPVIVLTGRREASIERQMRGLGATDYLTKPLDWQRLRAALEIHLPESDSPTEAPLQENLV